MQIQKTVARGWACFAVVLFAAGCGTELGFVQTGKIPHRLHERSAEQVEIFMTSRPTRPYTELGIVESQQERWGSDDADEIVAQMREYAGQLGCDGLVIFSGNDATAVSGGSDFTTSRTLKGYRGSCIVYTAAAAVSPPPLAAATSSCLPNATQLCYGPGACRGAQRCNADGKSFTLCSCGETTRP